MPRSNRVGYARGEETRARILEVAIHQFGNYGFDSVSTRDIASAAAVPPASLRYYFKSKEGLYIACMQHVQTMIFELLQDQLAAAEELVTQEKVDADRLIECFCELQDARIDSLMGGPDGGAAALLAIRHDLPSISGAGKLGTLNPGAMRMASCYIQILMRISGGTIDVRSALIVTGTITGQMLTLFVRRNRLAEMGWEPTPERLTWLKATIRKHTIAILKTYQV